MATASRRLLSVDEFFDFIHQPENWGRSFELDRGNVVERNPPDELHQVVSGRLLYLFGLYTLQVKNVGGIWNDGRFVVEREPDTVCKPNLAIFTNTNNFPDFPKTYPSEPPTVAIEILSANDRFSRTLSRLNRFLDNGVEAVWIVDPGERAIYVWGNGQSFIVCIDDEEVANLPALPGFRCKVSEIFDTPGS